MGKLLLNEIKIYNSFKNSQVKTINEVNKIQPLNSTISMTKTNGMTNKKKKIIFIQRTEINSKEWGE